VSTQTSYLWLVDRGRKFAQEVENFERQTMQHAAYKQKGDVMHYVPWIITRLTISSPFAAISADYIIGLCFWKTNQKLVKTFREVYVIRILKFQQEIFPDSWYAILYRKQCLLCLKPRKIYHRLALLTPSTPAGINLVFPGRWTTAPRV